MIIAISMTKTNVLPPYYYNSEKFIITTIIMKGQNISALVLL